MRRLITEFPILSMFFTSCLSIVFFIVIASFFTVTIIYTGFKSLAESIDTQSSAQTTTTYEYQSGIMESPNKILVIPITGTILTSEDPSDPFASFFPYYSYGYNIKDQLVQAGQDDEIKAVVLYIDSPGGTVTGSKAIYDGVKYFTQTKQKPTVTHISGLGASGGYMAAIGSDYIYADNGTLIGSIGVLMGPFKYYDTVIGESDFVGSVTTLGGIESYFISAGLDKDMGYPYTKMSEKATQTLQENVDREYESFLTMVNKERLIPISDLRDQVGALVYDESKAKDLKLIDEIGTREESISKALELANISSSDYQIVKMKKTDFWSVLFEATANYLPKPQTCNLCGKMLYLYPQASGELR